MSILHRLGIVPEPVVEPPPSVVELRKAMEANERARRLLQNRRPTGNRLGDAVAGYQRPEREERRELAD